MSEEKNPGDEKSEDGTAGDYKVGRGRTPEHTRFRKGRSGNPSGRPKGSKSFATCLRKEVERRITIMINGRPRQVTKREAFVTQFVNMALGKDPKAMQGLIGLMPLIDERPPDTAGAPALDEAADKVMESFLKRVRALSTGGDNVEGK